MPTREHSSKTHPNPPNKPGTNWVEQNDGLPGYIERVAKHIKADSPDYTVSRAIAAVVSQVKKRAATGNAEAVRAVAQWEALKARAKAKRAGKKSVSAIRAPLTPHPSPLTGRSSWPVLTAARLGRQEHLRRRRQGRRRQEGAAVREIGDSPRRIRDFGPPNPRIRSGDLREGHHRESQCAMIGCYVSGNEGE